MKYKDFYPQLVLESSNIPYGYWIDRHGKMYDVEDWGGHEEVAKRLLGHEDEEPSYRLLSKGFVRVAKAHGRDGFIYADTVPKMDFYKLTTEQQRSLKKLCEKGGLLGLNLNNKIVDLHELDESDKVISESPTDISYDDDVVGEWDNPRANKKELLKIKKSAKFSGDVTVGGKQYKMYKEDTAPYKYVYFLNLEETVLLAAHSFIETVFEGRNAIQNSFIWKMKSEKGFMRSWFSEYVSKKYSTIMSDIALSKHGFAFWQWLFSEFVEKNGKKMFVYDKGRKVRFPIKTSEDLKKYYGWENINKIFVLYTK